MQVLQSLGVNKTHTTPLHPQQNCREASVKGCRVALEEYRHEATHRPPSL
jgi:hypothetical protein